MVICWPYWSVFLAYRQAYHTDRLDIYKPRVDFNSDVSPLISPLYSPVGSPDGSPVLGSRGLYDIDFKIVSLAGLAEARAKIAHVMADKEAAKIARQAAEQAELAKQVSRAQKEAEKNQKAIDSYQAGHGKGVQVKSSFLERVEIDARRRGLIA